MLESRIRNKSLRDKIVTAEQAAGLIKDGMIVGMSGFTRAGDAKAVPSPWQPAPRPILFKSRS